MTSHKPTFAADRPTRTYVTQMVDDLEVLSRTYVQGRTLVSLEAIAEYAEGLGVKVSTYLSNMYVDASHQDAIWLVDLNPNFNEELASYNAKWDKFCKDLEEWENRGKLERAQEHLGALEMSLDQTQEAINKVKAQIKELSNEQ